MNYQRGAMMRHWITIVLVSIVCLVKIIKGIRENQFFLHYTIPQQLASLVKQAHAGQPFQTIWTIEADATMREALCAPLTARQTRLRAQHPEDIVYQFIDCRVLSHRLKAETLTGVVRIILDIRSRSGEIDCQCSDVQLRITVSHVGEPGISKRWVVSAVERLQ